MQHSSKIHLSKVVGHRGACGYAPENTIASLHKAQALRIKWVEFDIMLTHDNEAVVIHDTTLNRTTNGHGNVHHITYAKLKTLDAGSWFAKEFAGEHISTLQEFLQYLNKHHMSINVEIKPTRGREEATAKKVVKILEHFWPCHAGRLLVSSFSSIALATVAHVNPDLPLGYLTDKWHKNWQHKLDEFNCVSLNINYKALTPARVALVKETGRLLLAYTVNNPKTAAKLFAWGVDAVFSDYPDRI